MSMYSQDSLLEISPKHERVYKATLAERLVQGRISRLPRALEAVDFPIEEGESGASIQEKLDTAIRDCQPKGTVDIAISAGKKVKNGPVHMFIEFYGQEVETIKEPEVISDEMRINGEI